MAKNLKGNAAADMQPPQPRGAIAFIRNHIVKIQAHIQGKNQEIGQYWGKIEGLKINKKAAKMFAMLDKLEEEERTDVVRSLNLLIDASEWETEKADLVDKAQDNVVQMKVGGTAKPGKPEPDDSGNEPPASGADVDGFYDSAAKPAGGAMNEADANAAVAKAAARSRAAKARKNPPQEPYTGDNSDLADGAK